ncbi:MAG: hypothetical protein N3E37_03335 [Candidatus Micrarchaeota archaeon]|nr:hypothetical protein [Candidatus Micrarchaeota archaeon]
MLNLRKNYKTRGFVLSITVVFFLMLFVYDLAVWHELNATRSKANAEFLKYLVQKSMLEKSDMQIKGMLEASVINSMANITKWIANNSYLEFPPGSTEQWMESDFMNFTLNHVHKSCNRQISFSGTTRNSLKNKVNNEWQNVLVGYINAYNDSLKESGFNFEMALTNCDAKFIDFKTVESAFNYTYNISSLDGQIKIRKSGEIKFNVTIENLIDPVPTIELKKAKGCSVGSSDVICNNPYIKKIYFDNTGRISSLQDLKVNLLSDSTFPDAYGKGFSYGNVTKYSDIHSTLVGMSSNIIDQNVILQYLEKFSNKTIYISTVSEMTNFLNLFNDPSDRNKTWGLVYYSAGIAIKKNVIVSSGSIFKPGSTATSAPCTFYQPETTTIFLPHFNITKICVNMTIKKVYPKTDFVFYAPVEAVNIFYGVDLDSYVNQYVLITTEIGNLSAWKEVSTTTPTRDLSDISIKVYNISNLRYSLIYGLYFNGSNKFASFVQRLYNPELTSSRSMGVGGFISHDYFRNIINPNNWNIDNAVDKYKKHTTQPDQNIIKRIKGMPGCTNYIFCSMKDINSKNPYEKFSLNTSRLTGSGFDVIQNLEKIACDNNQYECD